MYISSLFVKSFTLSNILDGANRNAEMLLRLSFASTLIIFPMLADNMCRIPISHPSMAATYSESNRMLSRAD